MSAWLPVTVDRSTSIVPALFDSPPPEEAEPPVTVTAVSVRSPELRTSPPKKPLLSSAVPPLSVKPEIAAGLAAAVTSSTRSRAGARIVVVRAPAPVIVMLALTRSAPKLAESW